METNLFQKELLIEIKKRGIDFIHFVDISHLTLRDKIKDIRQQF